jgi:NUMOD4 motif/HNH endonuclease/AP2 domain
MEEWRDIPGYEGVFQVSTHGRVKSLERRVKNRYSFWTVPEKIIKHQLNYKGYPVVSFGNGKKKKTFSVHRLVATAFVINESGLTQVNHIDADKQNNYFENLEWCSTRENCTHRHFNKKVTSKYVGVSLTNSGKWNAKIYLVDKRVSLGNFETEEEARDAYQSALSEHGIQNKYAWQR